MTAGFKDSRDRQARFEEVNRAQQALELVENPAVNAWKQKRLDEIQQDLLNAKTDDDRLMVQARLIELNNLSSSLREAIATGAMAEKQIIEDRKATERRQQSNLEVAK